MKRWIWTFTPLILLLLLVACGGKAAGSPAETIQAMSDAYDAGDQDAIMALYTADSIVTITNDIVIHGSDIEKWVSGDIEAGNRLTATEIKEVGEIASFTGTLYDGNGLPLLIALFEARVVKGQIVNMMLTELIDLPGAMAPVEP